MLPVLPPVLLQVSGGVATASPAGLHPLHRCWFALLRALLCHGELQPVLLALDSGAGPDPSQQAQRKKALLDREEGDALVEAAEGALGPAAAAAVAALAGSHPAREAAWDALCGACEGTSAVEDLAAVPGMKVALALGGVAQRRLAPLAEAKPALFKLLSRVMLHALQPWVEISSSSSSSPGCDPHIAQLDERGLTVRSALAASAAAQLAGAGRFIPAAWLALEHCRAHSFFRVLDSGIGALHALLRTAAAAAQPVPLLPPTLGEALAVPESLGGLIARLGNECNEALARMGQDELQ
jgi:hypothetical protein